MNDSKKIKDFEEVKRVSNVYDYRAKVTDSIGAAGQWGSKELVDQITQEIIKKIELRKEDHVLEIGCGSGVLGNIIRKNCNIYFGFDASRLMLKKFQTEYNNQMASNLIQASATQIPFRDNFFDKVVMNGVSMYFPNKKFLFNVLNEIKRVSNNDSLIFIGENIVPSRYCWELVWFQNLPAFGQFIAKLYIKLRKWLSNNITYLAGKWKHSHKDVSIKVVQNFFGNNNRFFVSDSASYEIRKKLYGKNAKGNRRMDFIINLKK